MPFFVNTAAPPVSGYMTRELACILKNFYLRIKADTVGDIAWTMYCNLQFTLNINIAVHDHTFQAKYQYTSTIDTIVYKVFSY